MSASDKDFVGSIPQIYDNYLVPLIFDAQAIAARFGDGAVTGKIRGHVVQAIRQVSSD